MCNIEVVSLVYVPQVIKFKKMILEDRNAAYTNTDKIFKKPTRLQKGEIQW